MPTELYKSPLLLDPSLIFYFRMEGNSTDYKGNVTSIDTAMAYGAGYGKFGQGALFNGTSSFILLNAWGATSMTWGGWHYLTKTDPGSFWSGFPAAKEGANNSTEMGWRLEQIWNGGNLSTDFSICTTGNVSSIKQATFVDNTLLNNWAFLVGTNDGTNVKIYKNGVLKASTPSGNVYNNSTIEIKLGKRDSGDFWQGYQDDIFFFNRALTAAEISSLYKISTGGSPMLFSGGGVCIG